MSDSSQHKEIDAFFNFFATFSLTRPVSTVGDLSDGAALFEILSEVYVIITFLMYQTHLPCSEIRTIFDSLLVLQLSPPIIGFFALARSNASTVL